MKILLLGSNGQLGKELERRLPQVGKIRAFAHSDIDITNFKDLNSIANCFLPNVIINAAAYTSVDKAEFEAKKAYSINKYGVENLAKISKSIGARLIHYSTDYVFDGEKRTPYLETDETNPINVYGASKLAGEQTIINANFKYLIFRTTWIIGKDGNNFAKTILKLASKRHSFNVVSDQLGVPTTPSLITKVTIDALQAIKNDSAWPEGIYHLAPHGKSNWHEIAQTLISFAWQKKLTLTTHVNNIKAITTKEYVSSVSAKRPLNSQLNTNKLKLFLSFDLPCWKDEFLSVVSDIVREQNLL